MSSISNTHPRERLVNHFNEFLGRKNAKAPKNMISYSLVYSALEKIKDHNITDRQIQRIITRQPSFHKNPARIQSIAKQILNIHKNEWPARNFDAPKKTKKIDLDYEGNYSVLVKDFIKQHPELTTEEIVDNVRARYDLEIDPVQLQRLLNSALPRRKIDLEDGDNPSERVKEFIKEHPYLTTEEIVDNVRARYDLEIDPVQVQRLLDKQVDSAVSKQQEDLKNEERELAILNFINECKENQG